MREASRELCRALRGGRSQVAFARRLGLRGPVIANWEAGRRSPTITQVLQAAHLVGVDVPGSFRGFAPHVPPPDDATDYAELARWLQGLRGHTPQCDVARITGASRHRVGRWLRGEAVPRLHEFLALVHALSGCRVPDWVARLVGAQAVPSFASWYRRRDGVRELLLTNPWVSVIRPLVRIRQPVCRSEAASMLAAELGLPEPEMAGVLQQLVDCELLQETEEGLGVDGGFTMDLATMQAVRRTLQGHWAQAAADRVQAQRPDDLFSFNVFTASNELVEQLQELQRKYFRQVRALVGESATAPDKVVVMNLQMFAFGADSS
ncbi:MAG: DUF4423 domain-containing protein [Myxococcales bacterium]|nr:DUF4423 domain-containing protein [Myxococcales bacterium]